MTAVATPPTRAAGPVRRVGLLQVLRSEWTKLWSVRSTPWSLLALVVVTVGFSALVSWGTGANFDQQPAEQQALFDPTYVGLSGLALGQLALAVLGVLVITSEYSTGGIRTSLAAVPRRWRLVVAKALVLSLVALVVGMITSFGAFLVAQGFLNHYGHGTTLGAPHVLRAVAGGGLYLVLSALFGFAIGTVLRQTAASIVATVALLLVVPPLTQLLPGSWGDAITRWFTSNAGQQISTVFSQPDTLSPWRGYAAFVVETLAVLAVGLVLVTRRDA